MFTYDLARDSEALEQEVFSPQPQVHRISDLVNGFEEGQSAYFGTKSYALLASPPFVPLVGQGRLDLGQQVRESFNLAKGMGISNGIVLGAIPFDPEKPASLNMVKNVKFHRYSTGSRGNLTWQNPELELVGIKEDPDSTEFYTNVSKVIDRIRSTELQKLVLARSQSLEFRQAPKLKTVLNNLVYNNPEGYNFGISFPNQPRNRSFLGASPELLLSKTGRSIELNPMAGSIPRSKDPIEDKLRAKNLLKSAKDLKEHRIVTRSIKEVLSPLCSNLNVPEQPSLTSTKTMWHLSTLIQGTLKSELMSSLDLALAVHPTPAVGTYPRKLAFSSIGQLERFDRGLFTGLVGWCNSNGDGEWAVSIRCAEFSGKIAKLYAGAGIVQESNPESEYLEISEKLKTMLNALGNPSMGGPL